MSIVELFSCSSRWSGKLGEELNTFSLQLINTKNEQTSYSESPTQTIHFSTVYRKESLLSKESYTKILQSIYFYEYIYRHHKLLFK